MNADPLPGKPHIYVAGYAEIEVEPDEMTIDVALVATHAELAEAKADVDERYRDPQRLDPLVPVMRGGGPNGAALASSA